MNFDQELVLSGTGCVTCKVLPSMNKGLPQVIAGTKITDTMEKALQCSPAKLTAPDQTRRSELADAVDRFCRQNGIR